MLEAVKQLTEQVRGLHSSYIGMQEQMDIMHAGQQQTNYLMAQLLNNQQLRSSFENQQSIAWSIGIDGGSGGSPTLEWFARKRARLHSEEEGVPAVPLNSRSTFFETTRAAPSVAREWRLMEARRAVPFLDQYDLPEHFAIPDFRYP
jgi:hypothetical protein